MGYTCDSILLLNTAKAIGASETNTVVSDEHFITPEDSLAIEFAVTVSGSDFTSATFSIQHSFLGGGSADWNTVAKSAISMAGGADTYYLSFMAQASGDQADMPIRPFVRVVVSSGTGADFSVDQVLVTKRT